MRVSTGNRKVATFGMSDTTAFTIKATSKAFEILSSGLYRDKITAILREISANALDAHTDAGIPDRPFNVHLPTDLEPYLSIRDFGKGLPRKLMLKLYVSYFASLKEETNNLIGGLGLGGKSPFSYTDAFTIISRNRRHKQTYDLYKSETGEPMISVRSVEPLDNEETGLEVIVPLINKWDAQEFVSKASKVYELYPVCPTFSGRKFSADDIVQRNKVLEGKGWSINGSSYHRSARAIMGVIAYPIQADQVFSQEEIDRKPILASARRILKAPIDIDFNIGDLDITAGREDLSYIRETKERLRTRAIQIAKEIDQIVAKRFDNCATLYEAKRAYGEFFAYGSPISNTLGQSYAVTWNGETITDSVMTCHIDDYKDLTVTIYSNSPRGVRNHKRTYKSIALSNPDIERLYDDRHRNYILSIDATEKEKTKIVIDDLDGKGRHHARMINHRKTFNGRILLVHSKNKRTLASLRQEFDGIAFEKLSDFPLPAVVRTETREKAAMRVLYPLDMGLHTRGPRASNRSWREETIDLDDGNHIFVVTNRGVIINGNPNSNEDTRFGDLLAVARANSLIEKDARIVAVPLSQAKSLTAKNRAERWINFFDLVTSKAVALMDDPHTNECLTLYSAVYEFAEPINSFTDVIERMASDLSEDTSLVQFVKKYAEARNQNGQQLVNLFRVMGRSLPTSMVDFTKWWTHIMDTYPLMRSIFTMRYNIDESIIFELVRYIKLIDAEPPMRWAILRPSGEELYGHDCNTKAEMEEYFNVLDITHDKGWKITKVPVVD